MCRRIAVVSGKGGVGKSTVSAGIACALSKSGKKVLMVDCDVQADTQKILFGISEKSLFNLGDLMTERCELRSVIVSPDSMNIDIITPPADFNDTDFYLFFKNLMLELEKLYDYIIIDAPSGMDRGYALALSGADSALIVTSTDFPSVSFAEKVSCDLREKKIPACLIVNKIAGKRNRMPNVDLDAIADRVASRLIGALPVYRLSSLTDIGSMMKSKPLFDTFMRIAARLTGKYVKIGIRADY